MLPRCVVSPCEVWLCRHDTRTGTHSFEKPLYRFKVDGGDFLFKNNGGGGGVCTHRVRSVRGAETLEYYHNGGEDFLCWISISKPTGWFKVDDLMLDEAGPTGPEKTPHHFGARIPQISSWSSNKLVCYRIGNSTK